MSKTAPDSQKPRMDKQLPKGKGLGWIVGNGGVRGQGKESVLYDEHVKCGKGVTGRAVQHRETGSDCTVSYYSHGQ